MRIVLNLTSNEGSILLKWKFVDYNVLSKFALLVCDQDDSWEWPASDDSLHHCAGETLDLISGITFVRTPLIFLSFTMASIEVT